MGAIASQITRLTSVLLIRLFKRRSKKTAKLRVTGLCAGNSPVTGEFPAQMASNAENVSVWWRHHRMVIYILSWLKCGALLHSSARRLRDIVVRAVGSAGVSWVRVYTVLSFSVIHGPGCHRKCCHAYSFSDIFLKLGGDPLVSIPRTYFILGGCFSSSLCIMSPAMTSNYFYIPVSTFTNMDKL